MFKFYNYNSSLSKEGAIDNENAILKSNFVFLKSSLGYSGWKMCPITVLELNSYKRFGNQSKAKENLVAKRSRHPRKCKTVHSRLRHREKDLEMYNKSKTRTQSVHNYC